MRSPAIMLSEAKALSKERACWLTDFLLFLGFQQLFSIVIVWAYAPLGCDAGTAVPK